MHYTAIISVLTVASEATTINSDHQMLTSP